MGRARSAVNDAFRASLGGTEDARATRIGLEHEYQVWRGETQIDFRDLIHDLPIEGKRLDPGDANAYRLASGGVLTCDEAEAEFATPPLGLQPGFGGKVAAWARQGREMVFAMLPDGISLRGYSTHLSVSAEDAVVDAVAALYTRTFAPALMLILDAPDGLGVYVRPRPGRLELCSDYCDGARLAAAAVFAAGSVLACIKAIEEHQAPLPMTLDVTVVPATGRYGFYAGRTTAFGFDLYGATASTLLRLDGGGTCSLQEYLRAAWQAAREGLGPLAGEGDLGPVDGLLENGSLDGDLDRAAEGGRSDSVYGEAIRSRQRPGYVLEPVHATWAFTTFRAESAGTAYVSIPSGRLQGFFAALEGGALDSVILEYVEGVPEGRGLGSHRQTLEAGLWDEVSSPVALLPPERAANGEADSWEGGVKKGRAGKAGGRPGKPLALRPTVPSLTSSVPVAPAPSPPSPEVPPAPPPKTGQERPSLPFLLLGAVMAAILAGAIVAAAVVFGEDSAQPPPSAMTPTSVATATPTVANTSTAVASATSAAVVPPTATLQPTPTPTRPVDPTAPVVATQAVVQTPTPTPTRMVDPTPVATAPPTSTATATPRPTSTATPNPACTPGAGVACTPTPAPTQPGGPIAQ